MADLSTAATDLIEPASPVPAKEIPMITLRRLRPSTARLSLAALSTLVLVVTLATGPPPAEAQGPGAVESFTGCIQSVDQSLTHDQDRMRTRVYLRIQDPNTRERQNFGFFRNGVQAGTRGGSQLGAQEFAEEIEPILRQLREAARDRVHVEMVFDSSTRFVTSFRIMYDRPCD